jgi:hypothetical protein
MRGDGKASYLVDPEGIVIRTEHEYEGIRFSTVAEAVAAAEASMRAGFAD